MDVVGYGYSKDQALERTKNKRRRMKEKEDSNYIYLEFPDVVPSTYKNKGFLAIILSFVCGFCVFTSLIHMYLYLG